MATVDRTFRDSPADRFCAQVAVAHGLRSPSTISVVNFDNGMTAAAMPAEHMNGYINTLPGGWDTVTLGAAVPTARLMIIVTDAR